VADQNLPEMKRGYSRLRALAELLDIDVYTYLRFPAIEFLTSFQLLASLFLSSNALRLVSIGEIESPTSELNGVFIFFVNSSLGLPSFITSMLILTLVGFGVAGEIEKKLSQTILSYPVNRADVYVSKVLTAIGLPVLMFAVSELMAFIIVRPDLLARYAIPIMLAALATLGPLLMFSAILLAVAVKVKRAGISMAVGIAVWFLLAIVVPFSTFLEAPGGPGSLTRMAWLLWPIYPLREHYIAELMLVSFKEALLSLAGHFAAVIALFIGCEKYFTRRFEPT